LVETFGLTELKGNPRNFIPTQGGICGWLPSPRRLFGYRFGHSGILAMYRNHCDKTPLGENNHAPIEKSLDLRQVYGVYLP